MFGIPEVAVIHFGSRHVLTFIKKQILTSVLRTLVK